MSKEKLFDEFPPVSTEEWEKIIERDLKGADYKEKLNWQTGEGIEALPFYRKEGRNQEDEPLPPADHHWKIGQTICAQDINEANKNTKKAVQGGAEALTFQTEMRSVAGNIGPDMSGTPVQSQDDFSRLLKDISLEETELHFNAGMLSPVFMGMMLNEVQERGFDPAKVKGTFGYNPFSFILKHGRLPMDQEEQNDALQQVIAGCQKVLPGMRPLRVDAALFKNAGATIVQELGYALAAGSEYLAMAGSEASSAIHFNFAISGSYFLEIAKLRAARKLWVQILEAYDAAPQSMFIHGETALWNKSTSEPYTNIIRETTEVMSAAIAGCDTVTIQPFDKVQNEPNEFSQRIARNTALILNKEARLDKVADPAAGSWYIETLTDKIAEAAWSVFQKMERQGGLLKSIEEGTLQTAIAESRIKKAAALKNKKQVFVGVNKYITQESDKDEFVLQGEKTVSMHQTEEGAEIDKENLIPSIKEALSKGAAIGDIAPALFNLAKVEIESIIDYKID